MAYINAEASAPLTAMEKANRQHEAQQLMEYSILASNQDVGGKSQNLTGRDVSTSEYMKAKTYKKQAPINARTADYPDERN